MKIVIDLEDEDFTADSKKNYSVIGRKGVDYTEAQIVKLAIASLLHVYNDRHTEEDDEVAVLAIPPALDREGAQDVLDKYRRA